MSSLREESGGEGWEGKRKRVIVVPDEGRSPSEVESGLLYVQEHCARAFTPLNTQRQHTEIQNSENVRCTHGREQERGERAREREGNSVGSREIPRMRGRRKEREWSRKRKPALVNHPKMGYIAFVCVYVYLLCARPTPPSTAHQQTARISCDVRYAHVPGVLAIREMEWYRLDSLKKLADFSEKFSSAKPNRLIMLIMLDLESSNL